MGGHVRGRWPRATMPGFATILTRFLFAPVTDATGLKKAYDISLYWVDPYMVERGDGPSIFEALRSQLGLTLEPKKVQVSAIVIDHAERMPTEN
jgi:uncharacterized protein (TIGR03435 family)